MSNFCSHVWYGNSLALSEPSYLHYNQLIDVVKPGDIIEVYCRTHSVWAVYDKLDSDGCHWCYHLQLKESNEVESSSGSVEPDDFYKHCRELVKNCAPCAWEKRRQEQVWSRIARPSLIHRCCEKDSDATFSIHSKIAFVKHVQLVDLLKIKDGKTDFLFSDGLYFGRVNNQEILARKFGLVSRNTEDVLSELLTSWLNKQIPYNDLTLNSEHYVTAWKYGSSWCNDGSESWDSVGLDTGSAAIVRMLNGVGTACVNLVTMVGTAGRQHNARECLPNSELEQGTSSFSPSMFNKIQQKLKFI